MAGMSKSRICPGCGREYEPAINICVECGIDLRTGMQLPTHIERTDDEPDTDELDTDEPFDDEEVRINPFYRFVVIVAQMFPGLIRPGVLITSVLMAALGLTISVFGLYVFFGMGLILTPILVGVMIAGVGVVAYAQAVAWLIMGEFMLLVECLSEFDSKQWNLFLALMALPILALALAIKFSLPAR